METSEQNPAVQTAPAINEQLERRRAQQSLPLALIAGCVAALIGAIIWAAITFFAERQIGWMAVGVGFLVGYAVRFGKGIDPIYNIIGAVLAFGGCVLGNVFTIYAYIAQSADVGIFEVMSKLNVQMLLEIMQKGFSPIDLLFYGFAIYEGWRFSTLPAQSVESAS